MLWSARNSKTRIYKAEIISQLTLWELQQWYSISPLDRTYIAVKGNCLNILRESELWRTEFGKGRPCFNYKRRTKELTFHVYAASPTHRLFRLVFMTYQHGYTYKNITEKREWKEKEKGKCIAFLRFKEMSEKNNEMDWLVVIFKGHINEFSWIMLIYISQKTKQT